MAQEVRCRCGNRQRLPSSFAGRSIACEDCGRPIAVDGLTTSPTTAGERPPRRLPRSEDRDDSEAPERTGGRTGLIVLLIALPLLLCVLPGLLVIVGAGFLLFRSAPVAPPAMAVDSSRIDVAGKEMTRPIDKPRADVGTTGLIRKYAGRLRIDASSRWGNYVPENLIDGDPVTPWFSETGDSVAKGRAPWVEIEFPEDVTVARVQILGNRDPNWNPNYSILSGKLTFFDKNRQAIKAIDGIGTGKEFDFEFKVAPAVGGVRYVRFASVKDQGELNISSDVALGEIRIE